jgi:hypothetical protein
MKRGRPRKAGKRTASGRLVPERDYGCEGVQRRIAQYVPGEARNDNQRQRDADMGRNQRQTQDTHDPIGRAYLAGMLVSERFAPEVMRDAGRDLCALYWRIYGVGAHRGTLERFLPHGVSIGSPSAEKALEGALNRKIDAINRLGREHRRAIDSLCLDSIAFDHGPAWLDRLIFATRSRRQRPRARDIELMRLANEALEAIC